MSKIHLQYHRGLNKKLFQDDLLRPEVRDALLEIASAFIHFVKLPEESIENVIATGSNFNYNYVSRLSDIDVHVVVDFSKVNLGDYARTYFTTVKTLWGLQHNKIRVKGFPVELYIQDSTETLVAQGQYDLVENIWLTHPENLDVQFARNTELQNQADKYETIIDDLINCNADDEHFDFYKNKFCEMRRQGLTEPEGEFSLGNSIFKELRARKVFDRINNFLSKRADRQLSLEGHKPATEEQIKTLNEELNELQLMKLEAKLVEELSREYPEQQTIP